MLNTRYLTWFLSVIVLIFGSANIAEAQQKNAYVCETPPLFFKPLDEHIKSKSRHNLAEKTYFAAVRYWDADYVRKGCEAFLAGKDWDDSCLNGRRNLVEIEAQLPDGFLKLDQKAARKWAFPYISGATKYSKAAWKFCRDNGIYVHKK